MTDEQRIFFEQMSARLYEVSRDSAALRADVHRAIARLSDYKREITNSILILNNTESRMRSLVEQSDKLHRALMAALGIEQPRNTDLIDTDPGTPSALAARKAKEDADGKLG